MPQFIYKDKRYNIPEDKVEAFLKDVPKAEKISDVPFYLSDKQIDVPEIKTDTKGFDEYLNNNQQDNKRFIDLNTSDQGPKPGKVDVGNNYNRDIKDIQSENYDTQKYINEYNKNEAEQKNKELPSKKQEGFWATPVGDFLEQIAGGAVSAFGGLAGAANTLPDSPSDLKKDENGNPVIPTSLDNLYAHEMIKKGQDIAEKGNTNEYFIDETGNVRKKKYSDYFKEGNIKKGLSDIVMQGANSLPYSVAGMIPYVGLPLISVSAMGQQMDQLNSNPETSKLPEWKKTLDAAVTGALEGITERVGGKIDVKLFEPFLKKMSEKTVTEILKKGGVNALLQTVNEGAEEVISQLGSNAIDAATGVSKKYDPFSGTLDSFIYGAGGGAQFGGVTMTAAATNAANVAATNYTIKNADKRAGTLFENWDNVKSEIEKMTPVERGKTVKEVLSNDKISLPAKRALADYISSITYKQSLASASDQINKINELDAKQNGEKLYELKDKNTTALNELYKEKTALESELGDIAQLPINEVEQSPESTPEIIDKARKYNVVKNEFDSLMNTLKKDVDNYIKPQLETIDKLKDKNGQIVELNVGSTATPKMMYLDKGNLVFDENGELDRENSEPTVIVKDEDGKKQFIATKNIITATKQDAEQSKQAAKEIAYDKFVTPLVNKLEGKKEFKINEPVEFKNDKQETVAGTVVSKQNNTVTVVSNDGKKTYTYTNDELNSKLLMPEIDGIRVNDEFDIDLGGSIVKAKVTSTDNGQIELHIPDAPIAAQRFIDVSPDELKRMIVQSAPTSETQETQGTQPTSPAQTIKTSENTAENEVITATPSQQNESKEDKIETKSQISPEQQLEAEKQQFIQSLPRVESGKNKGQIEQAKMTPEQNIKYFEYNYDKDKAIDAARKMSENLKTRIKKEQAKLDADPFNIQQNELVDQLKAQQKTYQDYVFNAMQSQTEENKSKMQSSITDELKKYQDEIAQEEKARTEPANIQPVAGESSRKEEEQNDLKQKQYDIISKSNPINDEIHTGVRNVSDVLTAEEAFNPSISNNEDATPDFTVSDMKDALKNGRVTVYSSNPIQNGTFVTPSKMEAQNYAGKNKIYSKTVPLTNVAWIDAIEGQYAEIEQENQEKEPFSYNKALEVSKNINQLDKEEHSETKDKSKQAERSNEFTETAKENDQPASEENSSIADDMISEIDRQKESIRAEVSKMTAAQREKWWGEPQSLREYIMRKFIDGQKILWSDTPTSKGLGHHIGLGRSENERRKYIGLIGSQGKTNAKTPEAIAHQIWEEVVSKGEQDEIGTLFHGYDTMQVLDELLDVLSSYHSKGQMINAINESRLDQIFSEMDMAVNASMSSNAWDIDPNEESQNKMLRLLYFDDAYDDITDQEINEYYVKQVTFDEFEEQISNFIKNYSSYDETGISGSDYENAEQGSESSYGERRDQDSTGDSESAGETDRNDEGEAEAPEESAEPIRDGENDQEGGSENAQGSSDGNQNVDGKRIDQLIKRAEANLKAKQTAYSRLYDKYLSLKNKADKDPNYGMAGQADIFGGVSGSDNLFANNRDEINSGIRQLVIKAKAQADDAEMELNSARKELDRLKSEQTNKKFGQKELFGSEPNGEIESASNRYDVNGNKILTAEEWNSLSKEQQEKHENTINKPVTDLEGNTFNVDYNIAEPLQKIINAGFATGQSDSGTLSDHPGYRYVEDDKLGRYKKGEPVNNTGAYLTFWKPEATKIAEAGRKINTQEQIDYIRNVANKLGFEVLDTNIFNQPSIHLSLPYTNNGKGRQEILNEAGKLTDKKYPGLKEKNFLEWIDKRNEEFEPIVVQKNGGIKIWTDQEIINKWNDLADELAKFNDTNSMETGEQQSIPVTDKMIENLIEEGIPLFRSTNKRNYSELLSLQTKFDSAKNDDDKHDAAVDIVEIINESFNADVRTVPVRNKRSLIQTLRNYGADEEQISSFENNDEPIQGAYYNGLVILNTSDIESSDELLSTWIHETMHHYTENNKGILLSLSGKVPKAVFGEVLPESYARLSESKKINELLSFLAERIVNGEELPDYDVVNDEIKPIIDNFLNQITNGRYKNYKDVQLERQAIADSYDNIERGVQQTSRDVGERTGTGKSGTNDGTGRSGSERNKATEEARIKKADNLYNNIDNIDKVIDYDKFLSDVLEGMPNKKEFLSNVEITSLDKAIENYLANVEDKNELQRIKDILGVDMPDNALQYLLWRNANKDDGSYEWKAKNALKKQDLNANVLFRKGQKPKPDKTNIYENRIRSRYNRGFKSLMYGIEEGYFDRMNSLRVLQEAITGNQPIPEKSNAYMLENQLSSRNTAEIDYFNKHYINPIVEQINAFFGKGKDTMRNADDYMIAKHGLERNEHMANKMYEEWYDKKLYEILASNTDNAKKEKLIESLNKQGEKKLVELLSKDYSGLTALAKENGRDDFTEYAKELVEKVESQHSEQEIKDFWDSINNATKTMLAKQYDSGMISKEVYENVRDMYKYYVPLRGFDELIATDLYDYIEHKPTDFNRVMKKAYGRTSRADSPLLSIMNMGESGIMQSNRNRMKMAFYRLVSTNPSNYASIEDVWHVKTSDGWEERFPDISPDATGDEVAEAIASFNNEMAELEEQGLAKRGRNKLDVGVKIFKAQASEHAIRVFIGGQEKVIYVNGNPRAAQAINGLTNDTLRNKSDVRHAIEIMNRYMASFFTSNNPAFLVTNFMRDIQFALVSAAVREGTAYSLKLSENAMKVPKTIAFNVFGNGNKSNDEYQKYWDEFSLNGGETGYANIHSIDHHSKYVNKELRNISGQRDFAKPFNIILEYTEKSNRMIEDISRFATYVTSRQMGRSIQQSVQDAKEITLNFNRKGSGAFGADILYSLYLFANPALQGLRLMFMMAKHHPVKFTAMISSSLAAGYLMPIINELLLSLFGDDDDKDKYYNITDWTRRNNLVLYMPWTKDRFLTLMLPHELRAFYGMGEMLYSYSSGKTRHQNMMKEFAKQLTSFLPIDPFSGDDFFVPDVAKPVVEAYVINKNFMGMPVYKDTPWNKLDPNWTKAYKSTPEVLVAAAEWANEHSGGDDVTAGKVNINPARINHLLSGYFGGFLTTYTDLSSIAFNLITGRDVLQNDIPIANKLIRTSDEGTEELRINSEYFYYLNWMKEYDHKVKGYRGKLSEEEYIDKYKEVLTSDDAKMYLYAKTMTEVINKMQDIDKEKSMNLKKQFIEEMWKMEDEKK